MIKLSNITILIVLLAMLVPQFAVAAYNPAPERIVRAALQVKSPPPQTVERRAWAVCRIFVGRLCRPALNVAWCESGIRPDARNGQYHGVWQFGYWARTHFGYGRNVWEQTFAARRYHALAGFRPWECHP